MKILYDCICKLESFLAWSTLWAMVALIFSAGIARLCLYPINWAIDLGTCLFAWSCFLSADIAWRNNKLMNVDVLIRNFPEKVKRILRLVNYVILIGFLSYLVIFGVSLSYTTRARTFQGIPGFSYTWVTLSVPVGALGMLITTILKLKRDITAIGLPSLNGSKSEP